MKRDLTLQDIARWHFNSSQVLDKYHSIWQENIRLLRGIPLNGKQTFSQVLEDEFIYYRKTWSSLERVKADLVTKFLLEEDKFTISGIAGTQSFEKARVLENATKLRFKEMCRHDKLNILFMWAFEDLLNFSFCAGKLWWLYDQEREIDKPKFTLYPPEQVKPDFSREGVGTDAEMRYVILESYVTYDDMKYQKYKNIDNIQPHVESNLVRDARYIDFQQPLHARDGIAGYSGLPQSQYHQGTDSSKFFKINECFYRNSNGEIHYCVVDENFHYFLKKPLPWIFDFYPVIFGSMITEAHRLIPDSFPQIIKAPQEFHNFIVNKRRENIAINLNKRYLIPKGSKIDMDQFLDNRMGGYSEGEFLDQVREFGGTDITKDAYVEAQEAEREIAEITGSTDIKQGNVGAGMKATTAQIALQQSDVKQNMYSFAISETFMSDFFYKLSKMVATMEENQQILTLAHEQYRVSEDVLDQQQYDLTDFDFEIDITVSPLHTSKQEQIQNINTIIDRAHQENQQILGLIQAGVVPLEKAKFFNTMELFTLLVKKMGGQTQDIDKFIIQAEPPPPEMEGQQPGQPGIPSQASPQQALPAGNGGGQY